MRPAVVAGLVGTGIAAVVVIAFALVFAVQFLVFLVALPVGLLMGWYAGVRAATARSAMGGPPIRVGVGRSVADAFVAGLITALSLALFYVLVRLVFLYLDTGFRAGGDPYECRSGPECSYMRALEEPAFRAALEEAGVHDAAGYTGFFLEGQAYGAAALVVLVLGGALIGGVLFRQGRPTASVGTGTT